MVSVPAFLHWSSGILHDNRADAFADVLTGIDTGLEAIVNVVPGNGVQNILGVLGQLSHGGQVQLVAFLLDIVASDNQAVQRLGLLEVFELTMISPKRSQALTRCLA